MTNVLPVYKQIEGKYVRQFIEPDSNCILVQIQETDYVGQAWLIIESNDLNWLTSDLKG